MVEKTIEVIILKTCSGVKAQWAEYASGFKRISAEQNSWEHLARIVLGKQDLLLHREFGKDIGPNSQEIWNVKGEFFDKFAAPYAEKHCKPAVPKMPPTTGAGSVVSEIVTTMEESEKMRRIAAAAAKAAGKNGRFLATSGDVVL